MEFGPWADRMGASAETKEKLRKMLLEEAPPAVKEFWSARIDGDKIYFSLTEAIIIGRKG